MVPITLINKILSALVILGQLGIVSLLLVYFFSQDLTHKVWGFVRKKAFKLSFVLVLFSIFGSLYYSQIAQYQPCLLCWIQRILLFPQILVIGIAWLKNYKRVYRVLLPLNILGLCVASYHYFIQMFPKETLTCSSNGVSCSFYQFLNYGYITIPMMTITAFSMMIILSVAMMPKKK